MPLAIRIRAGPGQARARGASGGAERKPVNFDNPLGSARPAAVSYLKPNGGGEREGEFIMGLALHKQCNKQSGRREDANLLPFPSRSRSRWLPLASLAAVVHWWYSTRLLCTAARWPTRGVSQAAVTARTLWWRARCCWSSRQIAEPSSAQPTVRA